MAIKSYAEQLEEVQAAISRILDEMGGQAISSKSRARQEADLRVLEERERRLRIMVAREERGGIRVRRMVPVP